ncbi:MAG: ABC transporter substrate-binding protein [Thermomicrobiales bacterium]
MKNSGASPFGSRVTPADADLASQQWAQWRASRRQFLGQAGAAAGALALGGSMFAARPQATLAAQDAPVMGGSVSMSLADDDVASFDPIVPFDNMSIWTMLLIYDQLIRVGPDGLSLEGGLAETWDVSEDNKTYTFHLRKVNFHDGTPATSADALFCLNRVIKQGDSGWAFLFSAVDTIEAPDPETLVMTLTQPWAPFEADLALYGASIFPQAAFEAQGEDLWQHPIGTGPFMFDSWDKGSQMVLKKNPDYWDEGKPYLDEVVFKVLTDSNARLLQLQGGELDIATDVPFNQIEPLSANPDFNLVPDAVAKIVYAGFNLKRQPLDDKNLRQACNYAIDKDLIVTNVLFGAGEAATTYLPLMLGHDPEAVGYPYDLEKAKALIADSAGKDGFTFSILTQVGDAVGSQVAQLVAASLAQIGGTITIEQVEPGISTERVTKTQDFDVNLAYYTTDIIDPDELTAFAVYSKGGSDAVWTGYKNDEVDGWIEAAQIEMDTEKRQELYNKIQAQHLDDAAFLFLYYPSGRTGTKAAIQNFHILPTGNYRLQEVWRTDQ